MFKIMLPKLNFKIERWKWNKEYRVYVSTLGHIKNEYRQNIPLKIDEKGYCLIKTNYGFVRVHRLVMITFRPTPNAGTLTIDHLNHNKRDNSLYNLEWVTKKENIERALSDFVNNQKIKIKIISNVDDEVEKILKENFGKKKLCHNGVKIKNRILKSLNAGIPYCGYNYQLEGDKQYEIL